MELTKLYSGRSVVRPIGPFPRPHSRSALDRCSVGGALQGSLGDQGQVHEPPQPLLGDYKFNQPRDSGVGHLCAQLGTRTAATGLAPPPRPSDTRERRCSALYSGGQTDQRPKTEQLALRTRESDQFWTGRPVESLLSTY